jgi:cell division inhibitor SepF
MSPSAYADVRAIGEGFRAGDVISMDLAGLTPDDAKRMIDFASGLTFGLHGTIERLGGKVFLLTPKGVELADSVRSSLAS